MAPDSEPAPDTPVPHTDPSQPPSSTNDSSRTTARGRAAPPTRQAAAAESLSRTVLPAPPTSGWRYTFSSLSDPNFRHLWLGLIFMMSGMQMQMIARGFLVWEITGSAGKVGLVGAAGGIPMLGLALFGGAVADRVERKRLIQIGQAVFTGIAVFNAISITTETLTWFHLLGASLLQGVMWSFLAPARQAIIPQLVGKRMLSNALALNGAGFSTAILVAPTIGGLLYAVFGPATVYYIIAAMGLTAFLLTNLLPRLDRPVLPTKTSILTDIKAGLSYIRRNNLLVALLLALVSTVLLALPFKFLLPVFVNEVYQRESGAFGLMISMMGLGSLTGSLVFAALGRWRRGLLYIATIFMSGIALLLVATVSLYYAAIGIMVLLGLGDAGRRVLNMVLIMEQVEDAYQGRVMSVYHMIFGFMPLGVLPAGLAMDRWGEQNTIAVLGVLMVATAVLVLATQKGLRAIQ